MCFFISPIPGRSIPVCSTTVKRTAGAEIVLDIKDEDYGGRGYTCKDLEGHLWSFGTYNPWK
jgi:uncharacterized glyoxalase superfamily protein PhnB